MLFTDGSSMLLMVVKAKHSTCGKKGRLAAQHQG
jgi:hypothetical protein